VNYGNCDAAEVIEDSSEDDEISNLLRDLAAGLENRGDFEDNSSTLIEELSCPPSNQSVHRSLLAETCNC